MYKFSKNVILIVFAGNLLSSKIEAKTITMHIEHKS